MTNRQPFLSLSLACFGLALALLLLCGCGEAVPPTHTECMTDCFANIRQTNWGAPASDQIRAAQVFCESACGQPCAEKETP